MDWPSAKKILKRNKPLHAFLATCTKTLAPIVHGSGRAPFAAWRELTPVSRVFGYDRGPQSVARYYIDKFLQNHAADVRGCVLEIGESTYTRRLGSNRVTGSDVLHVIEGNPAATIVADLTKAENLPSERYECIIMPQTLQFIYDFRAAVRTASRILTPGGTLLVTLSGISQISRYDMDRWGEFWRFTELSARRLFEEFFPALCITVDCYGNVLAAISLLQGLASCELHQKELDFRDVDYPVIIGVRVVKPLA